MDREGLVEMLLVDLQRLPESTPPAMIKRMGHYIDSAISEIEQTGIVLSDSADDSMIIVNYAAWLWKKRDTGEGIPIGLKTRIHNRLLSEKGGTDDVR